MGGSPPSAPAAPDPKETIAAQSAADKEAIAAQAKYNRINEVTPTGKLTYTGTPGGTDYTRITSLTPDQQKLLDLQENIGISSYDLANKQVGRVANTLNNGFPANNLPSVRSVDEAGLPKRIGGATADDIQAMQRQVQDQAYGEFERRNSQDFDKSRTTARQSLADRGIAEGSELYNRELSRLERDIADAKQGAASSAFAMGQDYGLQQTDFANQSRDQTLAEQLAMQQRERELRTSDLQEQKAIRDVPLQDVATLLGYGSPQTPQVSGLTSVNINPVPAADIINQNYANQVAAYNARLQAGSGGFLNSLIGAGGMLGSAALSKSDARLKENVEFVGMRGPHKLYEFNYIAHPHTRYRGVMAQEVQNIDPSAVFETGDGFLAVDYGKLGFDMVEVGT